MAIQPKPSVSGFIDRAPDAEADTPGRPRQPKKQITVTVDPTLVEHIDTLARQMGQTRSAMLSLLVFEALQARDKVEG